MTTRRAALERLLDGLHPALQVVEQTADLELAQDWLSLPNLEGAVAKRVDRCPSIWQVAGGRFELLTQGLMSP